MTLGTKLSVDQEYLKSFSEKHQEPLIAEEPALTGS